MVGSHEVPQQKYCASAPRLARVVIEIIARHILSTLAAERAHQFRLVSEIVAAVMDIRETAFAALDLDDNILA